MQIDPSALIQLQYAAIVGRTTILAIAALSGTFSIFLGWKLYRDGILSQTALDAAQGDQWRFKLSAAGPGVFFALFGIWLLIHAINQALDIETSVGRMEVVPDSGNQTSLSAPALMRPAALWQTARDRTNPPPSNRARGRRVCFLAVTRIHYLDGDLSPTALRDAMRTALPILRSHAAGALAPREAAQVNDAIDTLADAQQWTGEWELPQ